MRDVARHAGDVPGLKAQGIAVKFHRALPGVADPDLQTVVEMQTGAGDIGNFPVISREQKEREIHREIVVAVFGYDILGLGHGASFVG